MAWDFRTYGVEPALRADIIELPTEPPPPAIPLFWFETVDGRVMAGRPLAYHIPPGFFEAVRVPHPGNPQRKDNPDGRPV